MSKHSNPTLLAKGCTMWESYHGSPSAGFPIPNTIIEIQLDDNHTITGANSQHDGLGGFVTKTYDGKYSITDDETGIQFEILVTFTHGAQCIYKGVASNGKLNLTTHFIRAGGPFHVGDHGRVVADIELL